MSSAAEHPQPRPEWVKVKEACRICGINRSKLYELIGAKRFRSFTLKEPGTKKGIRLIHLPALLAFIEEQATAYERASKETRNQLPE
jgi:hypothetical protein